MLATRQTQQEALSIQRTHSASLPAYLMRADGSVIRIWPRGQVEQIGSRQSESTNAYRRLRRRDVPKLDIAR